MLTYEDFRPHDAITRAEMAKIVVSYIALIDPNRLPVSESSQCSTFKDLNQVNEELQSYIIHACQFGLMGYRSDGLTQKPHFDPNDKITRAEVATVISRMLRGNTYA
jgi:hypothetical protein